MAPLADLYENVPMTRGVPFCNFLESVAIPQFIPKCSNRRGGYIQRVRDQGSGNKVMILCYVMLEVSGNPQQKSFDPRMCDGGDFPVSGI